MEVIMAFVLAFAFLQLRMLRTISFSVSVCRPDMRPTVAGKLPPDITKTRQGIKSRLDF